ncbi:hypothetical protein BN136_1584 [Cronobacter universalis NCTC 9529]|nr:hypothetical protein BN136_1584 [Cronobacter universalis NCTC 9529]
MQIGIGGARHIEVNNVADVRNINTACGHIGGDKHIHATVGQTFNRLVTLHLHHFAFEIAVIDARFAKLVRQLMHTLAFTHKHDGAGGFRLLQQMHQQRGFVFDVIGAVIPLMDFFALAGGWRGGDFHRLFQQAFGEIFNRVAFKRGGEQQGLFTPAGFTRDSLDILREAHIQHAVGFIKDQRFHRAAVEVFFFNVLQQATGRGDHDVLVFAEDFRVVHISHTAGDGGDIQMRMLCQFARMLCDLHRQLAGRGQDQNARRPRFFAREVEQMLQRRQQISCRFTGACRRRTEHITPVERRRNGGRLDSGRAGEAFFLERVQQAVIKFKFGKSGYSHFLPQCGAQIIDVQRPMFIPFPASPFPRRRFRLCYSGFVTRS